MSESDYAGKPVILVKKKILSLLYGCIGSLLLWFPFSIYAFGAEDLDALLAAYQSCQQRFSHVQERSEIERSGYEIIADQIFPIETRAFGEVSLIPAIDEEYHRLALFFADNKGHIVYKTDELEVNNRYPGEMKQPVRELRAVSFQELNGDGLMDIVLIVTCVNDRGEYAGRPYKIGDVLFQNEEGFYRDYRLSDKINRFNMNKSVESITSFVKGAIPQSSFTQRPPDRN